MSLTSRDQTGGVSVVDSDVTTAQSLLNEQDEQLPDGYVNIYYYIVILLCLAGN